MVSVDLSGGLDAGITFRPAGTGKVAVGAVLPGAPAETAGIRPHMRVYSIGGTQVQSCRLATQLLRAAIGSVAELAVGGGETIVDVDTPGAADGGAPTLGDAPVPSSPRGGSAAPWSCCPLAPCTYQPRSGTSSRSISAAFRSHLDDHIAEDPGALLFLRNDGWLELFNVDQCSVCGLLVEGPPGTVHAGDCERHRAHRVRAPQVPLDLDEFALTFPSLDEIYARQVMVRQSVPSSLRFLWGKALLQTINEVVLFSIPKPDFETAEGRRCLRAWAQLSMIAKVCLCSPPRAGERRKRQALQFTRRRIEMWLEGPAARLSLWESIPRQPAAKQHDTDSDAARERRAERLAADGRLGDAFKALCDPVPLAPNATRLAEMRAKHPEAQRGSGVDPGAPVPPTWEFDAKDVVEQLRGFTKGTAAGPSALSVQHLLDTLNQANGEALSGSLAALVNIIARGDAPRVVASHLAGGKLVALPKPPAGLRPVAVGESLRRLVARCLCAKAKARVAEKLAPYQFGVGIAGGGEALVHGLRQWWERASAEQDGTARVALQLDFTNAFNLVERDTFIAICRRDFPELVGFVEFCYAEETTLLFAGSAVASRTGVQQGDPLGPLLFCLSLNDMLSKAVADGRIPKPSASFLPQFFLDDGVLCGEADRVREALQTILDWGPAWGFELNLGKCHLLQAGAASIPDDLFPPEIQRSAETTLLKSPLGGDAFCEEFVRAKVESLQPGLDRLAGMEHSQTAFRILSVCAGSGRLNWVARTTPPHYMEGALRLFDERVRQTFEKIAGAAFSEEEWTQASLGPACGGFGLRQAAVHAPAAYIASRSAAFPICVRADARHVWDGHEDGSHLNKAIEQVRRGLPPDCPLLLVPGPDPLQVKQFDLSHALDTRTYQRLLSDLDSVGKARLRSCSSSQAAQWITAAPSEGLGLRMSTAQFQTAVKLWLGLALMEEGLCPCGRTSDRLGIHALHCRYGGGTFRRHNRLRDILFNACRAANLLPELEKVGVLPGGQERPADIYVGRWPGGGPAALDVAVISPLQDAYVRDAAEAALHAATAYSDRKANKLHTEKRCSDRGIRFQPMVVETFGAWTDEARRTINNIADLAPRSEGARQSDARRALYQRLSVALMRENAQTLLLKLQNQHHLEWEHPGNFRDHAQREINCITRSLPVQLESCDAPSTTDFAGAHFSVAPRPIACRVSLPETPGCSPGGSSSPIPLLRVSPSAPPSLLSASPPAAHS